MTSAFPENFMKICSELFNSVQNQTDKPTVQKHKLLGRSNKTQRCWADKMLKKR